MKRCMACDEEFDDKFSFCPVDATPLNNLVAAVVGVAPGDCWRVAHPTKKQTTGTVPLTRREFGVTIMDSTSLPQRLASELSFMGQQLRRAWPTAKQDPLGFGWRVLVTSSLRLRRSLATPHSMAGIVTALAIVVTASMIVLLSNRFSKESSVAEAAVANSDNEVAQIVEFRPEPELMSKDKGVGVESNGRVGFATGKGEGSAPEPRRATGGGSGGQHDSLPAQQGRAPQPSVIPAPIPKFAPVHNQALPVAGLDIDPALWKQLPMPNYGDPRSKSSLPSNGPGDGGGMGTNNGTGIGDGSGPGFGPGEGGNTGGGRRGPPGGGGIGGSNGNTTDDPDRIYPAPHVTERVRVISKPEPQYTEDARRNQVTGTVILRVVFSRTGEVTNIRALHSLPFGLTEKAIAAARMTRFRPATKDGGQVNVYMQLEYNFNLY